MSTSDSTTSVPNTQVFYGLLRAVSEDHRMIAYRPEWVSFTGSVTAAILLAQIVHHSRNKNGEPFYKFIEPCSHQLYRPGDSWVEELGFTPEMVALALKKIAVKISKDDPATNYPEALVWYYTNVSRVTYYKLNAPRMAEVLEDLYGRRPGEREGGDGLRKPGNTVYVDRETRFTEGVFSASGSSIQPPSEIPIRDSLKEATADAVAPTRGAKKARTKATDPTDREAESEKCVPPRRAKADARTQALYAPLAAAVKIDLNVCSYEQRLAVYGLAKRMAKAMPEMTVEEFSTRLAHMVKWFARSDWRGQKGAPLTVKLIGDLWGQANQIYDEKNQKQQPIVVNEKLEGITYDAAAAQEESRQRRAALAESVKRIRGELRAQA